MFKGNVKASVDRRSEISVDRQVEDSIGDMIDDFERGGMSRRRLVTQLTALVAGAVSLGRGAAADPGRAATPRSSGRRPAPGASTFQAVGLNHVALSVTDIPRSRDFYVEHLGLSVARESGSSCFLNCGDEFVALFRSREAGLNHYCYAIEQYDVQTAAQRLRENDLEPRIAGNRIYFDDPDGLEVQLSASDHRV